MSFLINPYRFAAGAPVAPDMYKRFVVAVGPYGAVVVNNATATAPPVETTLYAVWNSSDLSNVTLSNNNLTATTTGSGFARGTKGVASGKYYWEHIVVNSTNANTIVAGVNAPNPSSVSAIVSGLGAISVGGVATPHSLGLISNGNVIAIALDCTARLVWFKNLTNNTNWNTSGNPVTGVGGVNISTLIGEIYPRMGATITGQGITANFGASAFVGVVPSGFIAGLKFDYTFGTLQSAMTAVGVQVNQGAALPSVLGIIGTPVTAGIEYEHGVGSTYAGFTVAGVNGTAPYTYSVASGTLPSGITLNSSTGAVSGTPAFESAGTYLGIVIRVTDNIGATADLAPFTLTIAFKDPYWANTKLQLDYDAVDGNVVFTDQKSGVNMTTFGNAQHDTGVTPLYGTSTFLFDGSGDSIRFGDSALWHLGTSNFTIDFTAWPTSVTGVRFWIGQWQTTPSLGWVLNQTGDQVRLNISTTGSDNIVDLISSAGTLVINTWARWRVDFDGTKYRLYKNGTMVASSTTLRTINNSVDDLAIGSNSGNSSFWFVGNCCGIRLTVGTARTASDGGYTISNRAFPTS